METHESALVNGKVKGLQNVLDGTDKETRVTRKRLWKLYWALTSVLRTHRHSGRAFEELFGHLTWLDGDFFTFFRVVTNSTSSTSVVDELQAFRGLYDFLVCPVVRSLESIDRKLGCQ